MTAAERFVKRMLTPDKGETEEEEAKNAVSLESKSGDTVEGLEKPESGELRQRESALEAALNYLQKEGADSQRNPFSKGWAIKDGSVKDELFSMLTEGAVVEDELPKDETLQEHDRHYHPKGYDREHGRCSYREALMKELGEEIDEMVEGKEAVVKNQEGEGAEIKLDVPHELEFLKDERSEKLIPTEEEWEIFDKEEVNISSQIEKSLDDIKEAAGMYHDASYYGKIDELCRYEYEYAKDIAEFLGFDTTGKLERIHIESRMGLKKQTVSRLEKLLSMFQGIKQTGPFYAWRKADGERATTGIDGMNISRDAKFSSFIHESGHWIEVNSDDIFSLCKSFLEYRTKGEPYIHVGPKRNKEIMEGKYKGKKVYEVPITKDIISSPKWEIGKKDRFFKEYCGKMYFKKNDKGFPVLYGTEILSMGMEALFRYPHKFCSKDPEYAKLIIAILKGITDKKGE